MPDQSASLEIHVINVGQGDSVLVINRDLDKTSARITGAGHAVPDRSIDHVPYAVKNDISLQDTVKAALLIDGGDDEYGGDVLEYLHNHGVLPAESDPPQPLPYLSLLASHYHDDHIAGLRSMFNKRIDNPGGQVTFKDRFRPGKLYEPVPDRKNDPKTQRFALYKEDMQRAASIAVPPQTKRISVYPGGLDRHGQRGRQPVTISLGNGTGNIPIVAYILASSQSVWDPGKGTCLEVDSAGREVDQNDRSMVVMLEYGSFRCLLGGDIGGNGGAGGGNAGANAANLAAKRYFSQHADVESVLGPVLETRFPATRQWERDKPFFKTAGYATVFKANHHGSSSSVDEYFLATVRPLVFAISCGVKARFHRHPTQEVLNRVTSASWHQRTAGLHGPTVSNSIDRNGIYLTEVAEKVNGKAFQLAIDPDRIRIMGDIVIRPVDQTIAALQAATAPGEVLSVQVYGSGARTSLADQGTTLRANTPTPQPPNPLYPIGPFMHHDQY